MNTCVPSAISSPWSVLLGGPNAELSLSWLHCQGIISGLGPWGGRTKPSNPPAYLADCSLQSQQPPAEMLQSATSPPWHLCSCNSSLASNSAKLPTPCVSMAGFCFQSRTLPAVFLPPHADQLEGAATAVPHLSSDSFVYIKPFLHSCFPLIDEQQTIELSPFCL